MKLTITFLLTIAISILTTKPVSSQSTDAYFIIQKTGNHILTKAINGEKTLEFKIAGLNSQQQLDDFVNKFKALRGVVSITVAETPVDNTWTATAVFYKYANKAYFQNFFSWCGIKYILIDNKKYETQNFSSIKID